MSGIPYRSRNEDPPPAPGLLLKFWYKASHECDAKIDTGASITCVPEAILRSIDAPSGTGPVTVIGYDGIPGEIAIYRVNINVIEPDWAADVASEFFEVEVLAIPPVTQGRDDAAEVLIGRDLLRNWALLLEGPRDMLHVQT